MDDILAPQQTFDPVDLSFLTQRPPPFQREREIETMTVTTKKKQQSRKAYLSHFPLLNRNERNAKSHPFSQSQPVRYGKGIRLYTNNDQQ